MRAETSPSLTARVYSEAFMALATFVGIAIVLFTIGFCVHTWQTIEKQRDVWIQGFPKSVFPHLVDSDHFSIESKLSLLQATDLFDAFVVEDRQHSRIAGFPSTSSLLAQAPIRDEVGTIWGYYGYEKSLWRHLRPAFAAVILLISGLLLVFFYGRRRLKLRLSQELDNFQFVLRQIETLVSSARESTDVADFLNANSEESLRIQEAVKKLLEIIATEKAKLKALIEERETEKAQREIAEIALKVAHDVRSPLAALKILSLTIDSLASDSKELLKSSILRIEEIVQDLSKRRLRSDGGQITFEELIEGIRQVCREKEVQYSKAEGSKLILSVAEHPLIYFKLDLKELKRAFSNILDNSFEALESEGGLVQVNVRIERDHLIIAVSDNGKGIDADLLPRLGELGLTSGKEKGSGLGLYQAKSFLTKIGGSFSIESKAGRGTTVSLRLPWQTELLPIDLKTHQRTIVVIDDDPAIHDLWKVKVKASDPEREVLCFGSIQDFELAGEKGAPSEAFYFVDYQLENDSESGLDFILRKSLQTKSILFSGQTELSDLSGLCQSHQIRFIAKKDLERVYLA